MKEIFGEETKKTKAGIRLVREELFKIVLELKQLKIDFWRIRKGFWYLLI